MRSKDLRQSYMDYMIPDIPVGERPQETEPHVKDPDFTVDYTVDRLSECVDNPEEAGIVSDFETNPTPENTEKLDEIADNEEEQNIVDEVQGQNTGNPVAEKIGNVLGSGVTDQIKTGLWDNIVRGI